MQKISLDAYEQSNPHPDGKRWCVAEQTIGNYYWGRNGMTQKQKEKVLTLLKSAEANKNYENRYWISYKDFLDPIDDFTEFSCENLDGKQGYISLIENILSRDKIAEIFVEVYGYEEDGSEQFVYADTLIIFSQLPLPEIKQIFNEPEDIFPSDIGEVDDFSQQNFIVDGNGNLVPAANILDNDYSVYYCWWD